MQEEMLETFSALGTPYIRQMLNDIPANINCYTARHSVLSEC